MFLFLVGMFLDSIPSVIILAPILAPIAVDVCGLHPIHFALIMCITVTIGLTTVPVGMILYIACGITGLSLESISKEILPFLLSEVLIVLLVTYFPFLSMTIPKLLGYA
jgi:TRAP-type C4-dicarboxylate transport system permease large subunit